MYLHLTESFKINEVKIDNSKGKIKNYRITFAYAHF